jgi:hypothetical protein
MAEESSNPFLGKPISLVTKAGVRYEGKLYTVVRLDCMLLLPNHVVSRILPSDQLSRSRTTLSRQ